MTIAPVEKEVSFIREHKKNQFQKLEITVEQNTRSMLPPMSLANKQSAWKIFEILSKMGGWNENVLGETIDYVGVFAQLFGIQE